jgi:hypothetical protein
MRKPLGKKPRTSKAQYGCQCCQLHSRQDSCRLPCEQRFRQGDQCTCSAKEHHVPWTSWAPKADWLKRQGTAAYVQRQQIYDFLEIGPERQNNFNSQRICELTKSLLRLELRQLQHVLAAILGTGQKNMRPTGSVLQALTTSACSRSGVVSGS